MQNSIRTFNESDWFDVSRIYQLGISTNLATFQTSRPIYKEWDSSHHSFCRYVYEQNGKVVGWIALSPTSSPCAYSGVAEISIYIDSSLKGSGIGTQLLNHMIISSEEHGIWTLQSSIIQDNIASIALHKKCGFREIGYRERIAKDSQGVWKNTIIMERRSSLDKFNS